MIPSNVQMCLGKKILQPEDSCPFCPVEDFVNPTDLICTNHSVIYINKERIVKISLTDTTDIQDLVNHLQVIPHFLKVDILEAAPLFGRRAYILLDACESAVFVKEVHVLYPNLSAEQVQHDCEYKHCEKDKSFCIVPYETELWNHVQYSINSNQQIPLPVSFETIREEICVIETYYNDRLSNGLSLSFIQYQDLSNEIFYLINKTMQLKYANTINNIALLVHILYLRIPNVTIKESTEEIDMQQILWVKTRINLLRFINDICFNNHE